ncbi:uncharacterized protein LACBIDRAFT_311023 [Laccaria bicolor S238N-H82]|uniref:Predicted protein n=1 Tax=Laccaria bicolor (strain S238N-H82 / ATCC MYA-4686) TaxID=486041 RepID=B0DVK3_LACBS|nr:uncharacterized protein LACBIDRAFT_311023 [Laccaria bicolor S238N-H82]EDR01432.1 predicted protein [Laccaria bicolor S238N-H82]|eukprot:XP_001887977.1 predicted protein [Laccaria bicolor S238N-H82]
MEFRHSMGVCWNSWGRVKYCKYCSLCEKQWTICKNMAAILWSTLELYGIENRIMAIMMDNASNNDTIMEAIESWCCAAGIKLSAQKSCMHCMPHTIHIVAIKLLEGIGIISKDNSAQAQATNYQDEVNVEVECDYDMDIAQEMEGEDSDVVNESLSNDIQLAVYKLCKIVCSVHASPQCHQHWYQEVDRMNVQLFLTEKKSALMLILDVKT